MKSSDVVLALRNIQYSRGTATGLWCPGKHVRPKVILGGGIWATGVTRGAQNRQLQRHTPNPKERSYCRLPELFPPHLLLFVCASFAGASTGAYSPPLNAWLDEVLDLSLFRLFVPPPDSSATLPGIASPLTPLPCPIGPIPPLDDEEALAFEGSSQVDLDGLTPATSRALNRFERRVTLLGGKMAVTSAYRPPAYQAHLQVVWDKWDRLRDSHEQGCAVVRAQAQEEFERHRITGIAATGSVFRSYARYCVRRLDSAARAKAAADHRPAGADWQGCCVRISDTIRSTSA